MSRKSKRSQALCSSQRNNTLTQSTLEESFGELNINLNEQVNNLVRYFINKAGSHITFKQSELKKNLKIGPRYQEIIEKATDILKNVYGYNLMVSDSVNNSSREYIISNALPYIKNPTVVGNEEYPEDAHKILLLLILSHIFMSSGVVSDVSLCAFLNSFNIDIERKHIIFGNVKDYIHHNLKNKKYLQIDMDQISKKTSYSWGPRAEQEISKHEILKFVCKMYNDRLPNSWTNQYKTAEEQSYENIKEVDGRVDE